MENVEKVFHNDANVIVTQSRFIASGRTYTMRNISSVTVSTVEKDKKLQIALLVVGCLMALTGGGVQIAGFVIALGALIWLLTMKNNYAVRISTNAGESNSLTSADKAYVQKIVNAVNEAIIHRG
jgi:hypothetical protein